MIMENTTQDIFFILVKLKSYLTALINAPSDCLEPFDLTNEFFARKYPERKEELLLILKDGGISNECEIVFEPMINTKFKEIAIKNGSHLYIETMLEKLEIEAKELTERENEIDAIISEREESIKKIIRELLTLAKQWSEHKEIDLGIDDLSLLDEEELLRIDEQVQLNELDAKSVESFKKIIRLTDNYLNLLSDHFFDYRGNIYLHDFIRRISRLKSHVEKRYNELFNSSGLDKKLDV